MCKNGFSYRIERGRGQVSNLYTREKGAYIFDDTSRDLVEFRYRGPVTPDNSNLLIMPPQPGFNLTLRPRKYIVGLYFTSYLTSFLLDL